MGDVPQDLLDAIGRLELPGVDAESKMMPLTGGVSSDIWRIDAADGPVCIKRALPKLKVTADWRVPVGRSVYEVAWIEVAGAIDARAVPRLLASNADDGIFAMEFLDPEVYPQWKGQLMAGRADVVFAGETGRRLAAIHASTADDPGIAARFDSDAIFHAIRLEPYLEATARRHKDLHDTLMSLVAVTAGTKRALVHGDVSPKNILSGPRGPIFLDAECAWYGDPAFDLAFCLNHLLLKCLYRPALTTEFLDCFDALSSAYLGYVDWEPEAEIESRVSRLLPGLLLARVDGKSPVEYLTDAAQHNCVRQVARTLLVAPVAELKSIQEKWAGALADYVGASA